MDYTPHSKEDGYRKSCRGCKHYLGGGQCSINEESECCEGGGFELWEPRPENCLKCPWVTYQEGFAYCPFVKGTCMADNQIFKNAIYNDGRTK